MDNDARARALAERIAQSQRESTAREEANAAAARISFQPLDDWIGSIARALMAKNKLWSIAKSDWKKLVNGSYEVHFELSRDVGYPEELSITYASDNTFEILDEAYTLPDDLERAKKAIEEFIFECYASR